MHKSALCPFFPISRRVMYQCCEKLFNSMQVQPNVALCSITLRFQYELVYLYNFFSQLMSYDLLVAVKQGTKPCEISVRAFVVLGGTLQWPHKSLFLHYNLPVTFLKYLLTCFPFVWVWWVPLSSSPLGIVRDLYMFFVIICPASFSFLTKTVTFFAELSPPSSAYQPWIK